ncbi:PQQ-binding-like beta-propeller repeat protein [Haloplanus pelagicus]|uniref:outer membrane protein assembly factor BamB family protein n=1 Tax=Haloplanus pelagicus TaxID=2949995 RepID=UPI00203D3C4C|nr:PQQ-binding-like beta-propeller repeat protein [Haloplanus sp. HW8-1]
MPSITRRRLLGGAVVLGGGAYGTYRLSRGPADATLSTWTPAPGTWPLRRYDPANTAHNPNASPPRERPSRRELVSVESAARYPSRPPLIGPDHVVVYGSGLTAYPRDGGAAVRTVAAATPRAGFGPDGRLHTVSLESGNATDPVAVVGYGADDLRETSRIPIDTDHPRGLVVGEREMYLGTESGDLYGVDVDGGRHWRVDGTMPALVDGRLYAAGAPLDGTVAYGERTGLDRRLEPGPARRWSAGPISGFVNAPAVADGRIVQGTYAEGGGVVAAIDASTGDSLWDPRPLGRTVSTPAVVGDRGYTAVGTDDGGAGLVVALDLETGETVWRDAVEWRAIAPAVAGDTLVVAGEVRADGERVGWAVRAYDRHTGDRLWTHSEETGDPGGPGGPALVGDRVVIASGTSVSELA